VFLPVFDVLTASELNWLVACASLWLAQNKSFDHLHSTHPKKKLRPRSVSRDWSSGLIPSRITSLIYIDFDELEWIRVCSGRSERALRPVWRTGKWRHGPSIFLSTKPALNLSRSKRLESSNGSTILLPLLTSGINSLALYMKNNLSFSKYFVENTTWKWIWPKAALVSMYATFCHIIT
jgi:hypothetical protein